MTYDPIFDAWASYEYARHCLRLSHVASWRDYWRDCVELYAWEAQHLWSAV
jgi:hypothetical protein